MGRVIIIKGSDYLSYQRASFVSKRSAKSSSAGIDKLALGKENPGIGSEPISELRGFNEGRVYYSKLGK
jgi:hypothetical protein